MPRLRSCCSVSRMQVKRSPRDRRLDVGADGDRRIELVQDAGERVAVAHLQFDLGGDREGAAAVGDPPHRVGRDVVAVHDRQVAVDQTVVEQALEAVRHQPLAAAHMHAGEQVELARQRQVLLASRRRSSSTDRGSPGRT